MAPISTFFDKIDCVAPNFFLENFALPENFGRTNPDRDQRETDPRPQTGPDFGTDPTDRTNADLFLQSKPIFWLKDL